MSHQNYIFFFSHDKDRYNTNPDRAVFSQWAYSKFTDNNAIEYNSCEQYMMHQKALLMKDFDIAKKILAVNILNNFFKVDSSKMAEIKKLGRLVKNFDQKLWNQYKNKIVEHGNFLKFSQNKDLEKILLDTKDKILVEASPYDKIWGIGLSEENAKKINPKDYNKYGQNLLGQALMNVREQLRKKN
ncbi:protein of unknown function DUF1768 [Catovirus CTV1]|uniref:NADAR domain-containing protein n=1 Tax=Catovirus CTV1 TaxID=1977631 RepID=A0A1V0SAH3_9VIRU|nr:protein of unknown function DUF1768 [Catovirus CTV1]